LVVADLCHPVNPFAVELFLNGDMRHGRDRHGALLETQVTIINKKQLLARFTSSRLSSLSCRVPAIDNEGLADDKTCVWVAQPENGGDVRDDSGQCQSQERSCGPFLC
jgi:hypothetical protein